MHACTHATCKHATRMHACTHATCKHATSMHAFQTMPTPSAVPDHSSFTSDGPDLSFSTPAVPDPSFLTPAVPSHSLASMQPSHAANLPPLQGVGPLLSPYHTVVLPLLSHTEQDQVSTKLLYLTEMQKVAIHPASLVHDYHTVSLSLPRASSA
jgi:hypothetical protein